MGNGMNKILPGLYIGNFKDARDAEQLSKNKVTHILSVHDSARPLLELNYLPIAFKDKRPRKVSCPWRLPGACDEEPVCGRACRGLGSQAGCAPRARHEGSFFFGFGPTRPERLAGDDLCSGTLASAEPQAFTGPWYMCAVMHMSPPAQGAELGGDLFWGNNPSSSYFH
uniref:Dual specificity phosphatase 22 n=1 Tax=Canis lupus familiaris TaxID=9615 RepID=A0A8C0SYX5_CANLF